jgi:asparagine synthase (glutamine-hydrolysing)
MRVPVAGSPDKIGAKEEVCMRERPIESVIDLIDPGVQRLTGMSVPEARRRVGGGSAREVAEIDGSFALVGRDGLAVRMARSLDRPMRYFLAKRTEGPALVVSDRIDAIRDFLAAHGLGAQFHPSYTRMVPAHHVVEISLVGCPDPDARHVRFFAPERGVFEGDLEALGRRYIGALAAEIEKWIAGLPEGAPIGVLFSGGIDSGAVFLTVYKLLADRGGDLGRLKAFTLALGGGEDLEQARAFLRALDLELFLESVEMPPDAADPLAAVAVIEDYKPLDVQSAAMALALCRGVRERYPHWKYLADGDGGDENLKDYPIEENPELTIRSVLNNSMLYQEGWGVGTFKHSRTYSGGQSRSCTRTYAPLRRHSFEGFSPFTRPSVIAAAEGIPFIALTGWDRERLYALKGEIVARGISQLTGLSMPVFPKRRFQHGALPARERGRLAGTEADYRSHFASLYS